MVNVQIMQEHRRQIEILESIVNSPNHGKYAVFIDNDQPIYCDDSSQIKEITNKYKDLFGPTITIKKIGYKIDSKTSLGEVLKDMNRYLENDRKLLKSKTSTNIV